MCDSSDPAALHHTAEAVSWHTTSAASIVVKAGEYGAFN